MSAPADDDALADLLGKVADEFTEALHRGERPDVEDYARRHPDIASLLREVLPALQVMGLPAAGTFPTVVPPGAGPMPEVLGEYRLVREIGRGGMGIVYEAEQVSLKRRVALKVLPIHPALAAKYVARFEREAKTAAQLHHTNIVPVFAVGCEQGTHFYAMQLIEGRSLDHVFNDMRGRVTSPAALTQVQEEQARNFPEPLRSPTVSAASRAAPATSTAGRDYFLAAARIGLQVAEALEYAHQRGVVHRDIKPSNLILDHAGIVWVSDFGLVKCLDGSDGDNLTRTGDVLGTARYMSPEQALPRLGPADQRSDIYALGVTLYELLTLRPAFDAADQATLLRQIAEEDPPAPRQRNRSVPRDLETVVLRATAKDPRRRYPTAAALAADLRRFLVGEPIQARSHGAAERTWKWVKRWPAVAALLVVIVLATAGLVAGALWSNAELRAANAREAKRAREAEERERIGRRHLYAAHMSLAQQAWDRGHVERVRTLLDREQPAPNREDLRGFEWYYLWRLSHREARRWPAHVHAISSLAFGPQGRFLATASYDRTLRLWDPATGAALATLRGHKGGITALALTADGRTLATAGQDNVVRLWDRDAGKETATLTGHAGPVQAVAFSPDGKSLASASTDGTVRLWDVAAAKEVHVFKGHNGAVWAVAFHPDGRALASGGADRSVRLWLASGEGDPVVLEGHAGAVRSLAYSPDGHFLASGSDDQTVKLWDLPALKESATLKGHADPVSALAFSPDGETLASAGGDPSPLASPQPAKSRATQLRARPGEVILWDVATARPRAHLRGHTGPVFGVAFSPDGRTVASGGEDMTVILWDAAAVEGRTTLVGHVPEVNSVAVSPDGKTLLSASDDQTARLWDVASGRELACLRGFRHPLKAVAWAPGGTRFATGGGDKSVRLWDAETCRELTALKGHQSTLRGLAFSPDGRTLASCAGEITGENGRRKPTPGEAKLWDVASGRELAALGGHGDCVRSVAFSPDGRTLATGSDDKSVKLWDVATGKQSGSIDGLPYAVRSVAFAPDGQTLAIACGGVWDAHEPGEVKLWDVATGKERAVLQGHRAGVMEVAFAADGKTLATSSTDGTVKLWDPVTGQERAALEGHHGLVRALAFGPDGRLLVTGDSDGLIKLWFAARR